MSRFRKPSTTATRRVSLALLIISTAAWLVAAGLPFVGMSLALAGWITGLIIVAEGAFLLALALGGRFWLKAVKQFLQTRKD